MGSNSDFLSERFKDRSNGIRSVGRNYEPEDDTLSTAERESWEAIREGASILAFGAGDVLTKLDDQNVASQVVSKPFFVKELTRPGTEIALNSEQIEKALKSQSTAPHQFKLPSELEDEGLLWIRYSAAE